MRQSIKVNTALFEASSYIKIDYVLITEEKKKMYLSTQNKKMQIMTAKYMQIKFHLC